jgi:hypothetical protein
MSNQQLIKGTVEAIAKEAENIIEKMTKIRKGHLLI